MERSIQEVHNENIQFLMGELKKRMYGSGAKPTKEAVIVSVLLELLDELESLPAPMLTCIKAVAFYSRLENLGMMYNDDQYEGFGTLEESERLYDCIVNGAPVMADFDDGSEAIKIKFPSIVVSYPPEAIKNLIFKILMM